MYEGVHLRSKFRIFSYPYEISSPAMGHASFQTAQFKAHILCRLLTMCKLLALVISQVSIFQQAMMVEESSTHTARQAMACKLLWLNYFY